MTDSLDNSLLQHKLRTAVTVHVLLLPWWLLCWGLAAGAAMDIGFFIVVFAVGAVFWIKLLIDLLRWGRDGRDVTWDYPVRWAAMTILTIAFAIAFLIPWLRRWLELEPKA
jgi:ABC-type nickel/cobalt efflux system permease component RcnA